MRLVFFILGGRVKFGWLAFQIPRSKEGRVVSRRSKLLGMLRTRNFVKGKSFRNEEDYRNTFIHRHVVHCLSYFSYTPNYLGWTFLLQRCVLFTVQGAYALYLKVLGHCNAYRLP